jgi:glycosyltransferase involved in cell wall biosynthesis
MLPDHSVILDAQGAQNRSNQDRGISRYIVEQIASLLQLRAGAIHSVAINPLLPLPGKLDFLLGAELLQWSVAHRRPPGATPAVYHAMSPFELERPLDEIWPRWARSASTKTVVTLFDLIPLLFAEHYLGWPPMRNAYMARVNLVRSADHVLAISQRTADDAVEHLEIDERRITVIDAGVNDRFAGAYEGPEQARSVLRKRLPQLRPSYMLYVAGIEFRKNVERLIEAYARMSPDVRARHQLVIACRIRAEDRDRLERLGAGHGLRADELVLSGYVTDAELAALYHLCELFVFASFYEGSGLPILEAMACGAPVAASNTSTSPEILGDLDATFDPYSPDDMASVLGRTIEDRELLERLRVRSATRVAAYTWQHVAERTVEGYEAALASRHEGSRGRPARSRRPRIAWYSPWPPDQSGVATYNRRLLQSLGEHADIDVIVGEPLETYGPPREPGVSVFGAQEMRWLPDLRAYDRHVYCMGNSSFHRHVYEALLERPGVVVAHDVRFGGFYRWYAEQVAPEAPYVELADRIQAMYGERIDTGAFRDAPPTREEQEEFGLFMSQEIQEHAELLVTHSNFAADILRLDRPPERRSHAPIVVLPLAIDERLATSARREQDPLIVSVGVLAEIKGLAVLLDAFAVLARSYPSARLCLAGPTHPDELRRWQGHAREAGVAERVEIPGFVTDAEYGRLLSDATIAVQLRLTSNGEASASVADCLGAGVPTITTGLGWSLELPHDTVVRVPRDVAPGVLAAEIGALLGDPRRRAQLSRAARTYARKVNFDEVAKCYLEALDLAC